IELANSEPNTNDVYNNKVLRMLSGLNAGQERAITAYNGSNRRATVSPAFPVAPLLNDSYEIVQRNYPQWDATVEDGAGKYISPLTATSDCTKIFVINIGFGTANGDNDLDSYIQGAKAGGAPDASGGMGITLSGSNTQAQVVAFMKDADLGDGTYGTVTDLDGVQNVVSYFIMQSANNTQNQWAVAGGTGSAIELGSNPDAVIETISNIFKSILSVSTTFVAPSVPVNVFNRAQTVNEVFLALFEADENGLPLWNGNLKKVIIGANPISGLLELQDATGLPAIDIDGRLRRDALTFWTDAATLPPVTDPNEQVVGKDGRAITRGGAGQKIAGIVSGNPGLQNSAAGARKLFTENPGNAFADSIATDQLMPLDATVAVATHLWTPLAVDSGISAAASYGAATAAQQTEAIDALEFARGLLPDGATPRPWMMADPLHSRPRPINYGARTGFTATNPDIRIVLGTNEGYLRMIQNTNTDTTQSGKENWAYMPRAALKTLTRLENNLAGDPKHPNTADGSPVVLVKDVNLDGTIKVADGDQVLVFFGMRRGGRNIYALDITDPDNPVFKWRILGGSGDFTALSQTWSTPQVGRVKVSGVTKDVLVFGGGYNGDDSGAGSFAACDANSDGTISAGAEQTCADALGKDLANRITRHNKANDPDRNQIVGANDPKGNA
ncbi:MAG: PilC/PilY family type IV pilus protein, partial [Gammaproteobacteria bacterium]|nr:PilC/PilY family type IV pilus protein [Gammaproteobacteria bacterium]